MNNQGHLVLGKSFLVPGAHSHTERIPELQSSDTLASPPHSRLGTSRNALPQSRQNTDLKSTAQELYAPHHAWLRKAQAHHLLKRPLFHPGNFLSSKSNICRAFQKLSMLLRKPYRGSTCSPGFHRTWKWQSLHCYPARHQCRFPSLEAPEGRQTCHCYRTPQVLHRPAFPRRLKMHHQSFLASLAP